MSGRRVSWRLAAFTLGPALPVGGAGSAYTAEYAMQLTLAEVDFSPGTITPAPPITPGNSSIGMLPAAVLTGKESCLMWCH